MTKKRSEDSWTVLTRRNFLKTSATVGAAAVFSGCLPGEQKATPPKAQAPAAPPPPVDDNPIADSPEGVADKRFFGDGADPMRFHSVLWNKAEAISSRGGLPSDPAKFERTRLCIVGGGVSGLSTAYLLREFKPIVLEGATRLGGNAKGLRWNGVTFGIGAAYITNAAETDEHIRMLKELGLTWRVDDPTHDMMHIDGIIHPEFWFGGTDKKRAADFRAAWDYFKKVRETAFPEIPFDPKSALTRAQWTKLDERSFAAELEKSLGKKLHPHVADLVRQYCWSSFGCDSTEVSAAAGLNFLASDLGGMYVFPGANSAISQGLVTRLRKELGHDALRSSLRVLDVRRADDGVRITYVDAEDKLRTILAEACVVSTPKFVAKKLIDDLPAPQLEAIAKLKYRAYVVGHVLVDQPRKADFHDLYCIAGKAPAGSLKDELASKRAFTDVILTTFATEGHPSKTVLNMFRSLPYDESRAELFAPDAYAKQRAVIEAAVPKTVEVLGLDPKNVKDVRLTGWGHPMIVPSPGLISSGVPAAAAAPHKERIFFAQQDNNAMSAFESAFAAAQEAREHVKKVLGA